MGLLSKYIKAKKETPEQKMEENINMKQDILDMGVLVTGQKGTEVLVPSIKENEENKIEECVQGLLDIIDGFSTDKNDEEMNMETLVGEVFTTRDNDILFLVVGNDEDNEYNLVILRDFNNAIKELDLSFAKVVSKEELTTNFVHVPYVEFTGTLELKGEK